MIPLIAMDVDVLLEIKPKKIFGKLFGKRPASIIDAEYACIQLRKLANVVLLSQYEIWQNEAIREAVETECYNYLVPARSRDEFELFKDNFLPYMIISSIPKKLWGGEYTDVHEHDGDWRTVFNIIREEIPVGTERKDSSEMA